MTRESGRPCGCDPKANHPCTGHAAHVDETKAVFTNGFGVDIVVSGPDTGGVFTLTILNDGEGAVTYIERFQLEDIIDELQRRLRERA